MTDTGERAFRTSLSAVPPVRVQIAAMFSGPAGKLAVVAYVAAIGFFALGIWTALHMRDAPDLRGTILWFAAAAACWTSVLTCKLWIWNRFNTLEILRAIHRAQIEAGQPDPD